MTDARAILSSIPRLAGVCAPESAMRPGMSVSECSSRLKRLAYVKKRLALLAAGRINQTPEWEVKAALAFHAYLDAEHACALRRRLLELREPAARVDATPDPALAALMDQAASAASTMETLVGIYGVLRPALLSAYAEFLSETNPLADQPSCRLLRQLQAEETDCSTWGSAALACLSRAEENRATGLSWSHHLQAFFHAAGGLTGPPRADVPLPPARSPRPFAAQPVPLRDARFSGLYDPGTAVDLAFADDSRSAAERNLALLFKRAREMDSPEVLAGVIAESADRAWDQLVPLFRQVWDEARHALLGEVGLEAHGVALCSLPVNVTFSHKLNVFCSARERHAIVYAIEHAMMPPRRGKRYEWEVAKQAGDALSTTFHDFDWADEVFHIRIARDTLSWQFVGGLAEAKRTADAAWQRMTRELETSPLPAADAPADWFETFVKTTLAPKPPSSAPAIDSAASSTPTTSFGRET